MIKFLKVMIVMLTLTIFAAPAMACQYCQNEDPGINMVSTLDFDAPSEATLQKIDLSFTPGLANIGTDLTLIDIPLVSSSLGVLQASSAIRGSEHVGLSFSYEHRIALKEFTHGVITAYSFIDPGRTSTV